MNEWSLNGALLAGLGLRIVSGQFRASSPSTLRLEHDAAFDATPLLAYGDAVTLTYDDGGTPVTYFQGKVISVPRHGSADSEGQGYEIADAWYDLERTTYQEEWGFTTATLPEHVHANEKLWVPRAVFGLDDEGNSIRVNEVIEAVVAYAAANGVSIAVGTLPTGEYPLQADITNASCAEVIRMALRLHPDWIPWIDHSTPTPTLNVTKVSSMTVHNVPVDGSAEVEFDVVERQDLLPESVRICYEYAIEAINPTYDPGEPEIYRKMTVDKFPLAGPDAGPGVINTLIPLPGLSEQRQKSRLWTRRIPEDPTDLFAVDWFKAKYPHLATVPSDEITITSFDREMIMEWMGDPEDPQPDKDPPAPINPQAKRIALTELLDDYPRELYKGQIEDWMRLRVGRMWIRNVEISALPGASEATLKALEKGFPAFTITATNGRSKVYAGPSQWNGTEDVPEGIAESVYNAIVAANRWQGSCTVTADEVPLITLLGKKLRLTGSAETAWSTMEAPINSYSFDIDSGSIAINFGPSPYLSPADFLELQRTLRAMPLSWWTPQERDKERSKHGSTDGPSGIGDTVGGFDGPETVFESWDESAGAFYRKYGKTDGIYLQGGTVTGGEGVITVPAEMIIDKPAPPAEPDTLHPADHHMWLKCDGDGYVVDGFLLPGFTLTAVTVGFGATVPDNVLPTVDSYTGTCYVSLGVFTENTFLPSGIGNVLISFCPGAFKVERDANVNFENEFFF